MKRLDIELLTLLLIPGLLGLGSCRNSQTGPGGGQPKTVFGAWVWLRTQGGFAGTLSTPPPPRTVTFRENGTVSFYQAESLIATTPFFITREKPYEFSSDSVDVIRYGNTSIRQTYTILSDTLILDDLCIDCFRSVYKKATSQYIVTPP